MRLRLPRIHLLTALVIYLILAILVWANVRTKWAFYGKPDDPYEYAADHRGLVYYQHLHGWPFECCERREFSDETEFHWHLVNVAGNVVVAVLIAGATAYIGEFALSKLYSYRNSPKP